MAINIKITNAGSGISSLLDIYSGTTLGNLSKYIADVSKSTLTSLAGYTFTADPNATIYRVQDQSCLTSLDLYCTPSTSTTTTTSATSTTTTTGGSTTTTTTSATSTTTTTGGSTTTTTTTIYYLSVDIYSCPGCVYINTEDRYSNTNHPAGYYYATFENKVYYVNGTGSASIVSFPSYTPIASCADGCGTTTTTTTSATTTTSTTSATT